MNQVPSIPAVFFNRIWRWLTLPGFARGAFWAIMIVLVSNLNDVTMKFLGERLDALEIVFFRFFFSMIMLFPFMVKEGKSSFKTSSPKLHFYRALLGAAAISACCYSVVFLPLTDVTTLFFTQPLFFLPMAMFFLKEHVGIKKWIANIIGFIGILIVVRPGSETFSLVALIPISGAIMFALMDVLAKKMIINESRIALLFYFALGTTLIGFIPALLVWKTPTFSELGLLFISGFLANAIQVCLFLAFSATEASSLTPFRYLELLFSSFFGYIFFKEIPSKYTLAGAVFIILATLYISYEETRRKRLKKQSAAS